MFPVQYNKNRKFQYSPFQPCQIWKFCWPFECPSLGPNFFYIWFFPKSLKFCDTKWFFIIISSVFFFLCGWWWSPYLREVQCVVLRIVGFLEHIMVCSWARRIALTVYSLFRKSVIFGLQLKFQGHLLLDSWSRGSKALSLRLGTKLPDNSSGTLAICPHQCFWDKYMYTNSPW